MLRLSLTDESGRRREKSLRFTRSGLIVRIISCIVVLCALVYVLMAYTPLRSLIPGYPDSYTRRAAIENAIRIDSLQSVISRWEIYSENILRVMEGNAPLPVDSVIKVADAAQAAARDEAFFASSDSLLRDYVTKEEQFGISSDKERDLPIEGRHFFTPLKGVISKGYDSVLHPYLDITAPAGSVVTAAADGYVIFDGWNDESGYTIILQHEGDVATVYKHNEKLLKNTGDKVSAGSPVALTGGSITTGDHLHFEMWYHGIAVDPTKYINF